MGLSIHYNGHLKNPDSLQELIAEVKDISDILKWNCHVYEEEFPEGSFDKEEYEDKIYGISLSAENCEPVWICFLSNGRMSSPLHLQFWGDADDPKKKEYLYMLSTKTQFAGIEAHQFIIHLFHHINKKYLAGFEVTDEGGYWETGDEKVLANNFKKYINLLNSVANALENMPKQAGETFEQYFERLLLKIQDNRKSG